MREPNFKYFKVESEAELEEHETTEEALPESDLSTRARLVVLPPIDEYGGDAGQPMALLPHELVEAMEADHTGRAAPTLAEWLAVRCAPLLGFIYDLQMRSRGVRLVRHRVQVSGLPRQTPALRVAFISDLHYGPTSGHVASRQAWRQLHEAEPDLVLLGGDYLFGDHRGLPALLRELQRWKWDWPRCGIYAVLGDGDYARNTASVVAAMEACGVRILRNEAVPLPEPWEGIWLAGLDDAQSGTPDIGCALESIPSGAPIIMLSHSATVCAQEELKRCRLTLCGHAHGGQICAPNGDSLFGRSGTERHFAWGMQRHAGNWVFVSRGVGVCSLPVRLFAPPDVAVFEIGGGGMGPPR